MNDNILMCEYRPYHDYLYYMYYDILPVQSLVIKRMISSAFIQSAHERCIYVVRNINTQHMALQHYQEFLRHMMHVWR